MNLSAAERREIEQSVYDRCNGVLAAFIDVLSAECDQWRSRALRAESALEVQE